MCMNNYKHVEQTSATLFREEKCQAAASNSSLTLKYTDKTTQASITVSFVLKLTGSPVLTQFHTGPKIYWFSVPIPHECASKTDMEETVE